MLAWMRGSAQAGRAGRAAAGPRHTGLLVAVAGALMCYGALCKVLLFRNLEYTGSDLYGILDQSRSWLYTGRLLQDNAYGNQAAIHGYYLLPVLSPLTIWLGAYGLFLVLALLELLAALRVVSSRALDTPARLAVLAGLVSPLAFYALDDPVWGFHPELLYPSLAVLLAVALIERRRLQAVLLAVVIVLVKEDGALVCGGVLAAHYTLRLWLAPSSGSERRRIALRAAAVLAVMAAVFVLGLALLWWAGHGLATEQETAGSRLGRAWGILVRTLRPGASEARRAALVELLVGYAAVSVLLLLPLGARLSRGLLLLLVSGPAPVLVLLVSGAHYKFADPLWAQRIATLMAVALACVALAGSAGEASPRAPRLGWSAGSALALGALSWALQLGLLARIGYSLRERVDPSALWSGRGYAVSALAPGEARLWRCVAARLPGGTPVSPVAEIVPFFHRQSIVFQGLESRASRPARLRVYRPAPGTSSNPVRDSCPGPRVRDLVPDVDCELQVLLAPCGWPAPP